MGDEMTILRGVLDENRYMLLWKLEGMTEEDARRPMVPSGTSLLGLVKHLAWVERWWFVDFVGGTRLEYPWSKEDPDADFRIDEDETIASTAALYEQAIGEADAVLEQVDDLDDTREFRDVERSIRWVLVHMIEETARHAGHADIVRELIDGTTGYLPGD